jgi:hypothetical protein
MKIPKAWCFLWMGLWCCAPTEKEVSDEPPGRGFEIEARMEPLLSGGNQLIIDLIPDAGNFVVSPLSQDDFYGRVQLEFDTIVLASDQHWTELPPSRASWDEFSESLVRFVQTPTRFSVPLNAAFAQDFTSEAKVFFVIEPQCIPYVSTLTVKQVGGTMSAQVISIEPAI